jgi:hypothetical protein
MRVNRTTRFAPVRGDDGHDRSFITRDFNRGSGKENGTIPFYRRFFDRINKIIKIQNLQSRMHSVYTKFTRIRHLVYIKNTLSEQSVYTRFTPGLQSVNTEYTLNEQAVHRPIRPPLCGIVFLRGL